MAYAVSDTWALVGRHMRHIARIPEKLLSITLMPVAYVVIFGCLFGTAIAVPGGDYREYLMAGIFTQTMLSNISNTALGVADDLGNGLVDRFRSLPMSQPAVLVGRTVSALVLSALSCTVMAVVGFAIGWRVHHGVGPALAAFGLLLLLGFAMAWLGALIGLLVRGPEAISAVAFVIVMPLTFLSNAFIPLGGLPAWLRTVCEWNPISAVIAACRELFGNPTALTGTALPSRHPVPMSVALTLVVIVVVAPLATRAYRTAVAR
ncbi:ABC transporter permease [Solihabitans fulvus]|uniref:Transport permease protein n=1 Tax=Solihabitans fulvus TaxID=1892852 RepID=A0A5B2WSJ1_9PSEU|nr:ABC transporter permease [Solihabitans fulvus]